MTGAIPPILTHSAHELHDYYERQVKKPRWRPWLANADQVEVDLHVGPVKVGKVKELFRGLTKGSRYRYAALKWLRPHSPCMRLEDIPGIQKAAGLDHLDNTAFLPGLMEDCKEILRDHQRLSHWVRKRLALLEHPVYAPKLAPRLNDVGVQLRQGLLGAVNFLWQDRTESVELSERITDSALQAAAQAVGQILGKHGCPVSANLMIPVRLPDEDGPRLPLGEDAAGMVRAAADLWRGQRAPKCLVIVAGTRGSPHVGFWVPLVRGHNGTDLAGASAAYFRGQGSAVFKDDLPSLEGFPPDLTERWHAYLRTHLHERMFVSIPFCPPASGLPGAGKISVAVLNVNAEPPEEDGWYRAYHPEWLELATEAAAPFIETAYYSLLVTYTAGEHECPEIETGSEAWNTIPGASAPRLLPGESHGEAHH